MNPRLTAVLIWSAAFSAYALDTPVASSTTSRAVSEPATAPVAVSTETKSVIASTAPARTAEAEPGAMAESVAPLQRVVTFHENEIVSVKQMMDRWNGKIQDLLQRRQSLDEEVQSRLKQADELLQKNTKADTREAARLKKDAGRISKDMAAIDREIKGQMKDLVSEVRDVSSETQQALRDAYQQVIADIQKSQP
jgi:hypothetical protein